MATVASLWVGAELPILQQICLSSFVYHGHRTVLFVYNMDMEVPEGIEKVDANKIIPESQIFYHWNQLAAFSDLFRYKMIAMTDAMWVDADTLCLGDYFFEDRDIVFIKEAYNYAGGVLKLKGHRHIAEDLYNQSIRIISRQATITKNDTPWGLIGPVLLSKVIKRKRLDHFAINYDLISGFRYSTDSVAAWDPNKTEEVMEMLKDSYAMTFFNGGLTMMGIDKTVIPEGSFVDYCYKKYLKRTIE